eukprot:GHRR01033270.1.p1 GENE.GHRR01033270.1~~GHRR01033270.1.p1  ORF type:complete len:114 (-),score=19.97 GHRR01033270.1:829-1170(-)
MLDMTSLVTALQESCSTGSIRLCRICNCYLNKSYANLYEPAILLPWTVQRACYAPPHNGAHSGSVTLQYMQREPVQAGDASRLPDMKQSRKLCLRAFCSEPASQILAQMAFNS